jgi:hypothetical protein
MLRGMALTVAALLLCAATEPPPLPAPLEPYVVDGELVAGDYRWAKGNFADATEQERADYRAINQWAAQCMESARAEARQRLAAMGYAEAQLKSIGAGPLLCRQVLLPFMPEVTSYAEFEAHLRQAMPIADTYLMAVGLAEEIGRPRSEELSDALIARTLGEQMLRRAMTWGRGDMAERSPELPSEVVAIVRWRLSQAMVERDLANTEWLKGMVADRGWPKISEVGEAAANEAWLLVQHADADPVFQVEALRLMEPLVAQKEVSGRNFAYLTDRVAMKLTGKQRYGTQFMCVDGQYSPQPVEDEAAVDWLRREAGMETQTENTARMRQTNGPC